MRHGEPFGTTFVWLPAFPGLVFVHSLPWSREVEEDRGPLSKRGQTFQPSARPRRKQSEKSGHGRWLVLRENQAEDLAEEKGLIG